MTEKQFEGGWPGEKPVPDATPPVVRGGHAFFLTRADQDAIYAGCGKLGLRVLGVEGTRQYRSFVDAEYDVRDLEITGGAYRVKISIDKEAA